VERKGTASAVTVPRLDGGPPDLKTFVEGSKIGRQHSRRGSRKGNIPTGGVSAPVHSNGGDMLPAIAGIADADKDEVLSRARMEVLRRRRLAPREKKDEQARWDGNEAIAAGLTQHVFRNRGGGPGGSRVRDRPFHSGLTCPARASKTRADADKSRSK